MELFLDRLIDLVVKSTNNYAKKRLPADKFVEVKRPDILRFSAIYYYMGVVRLPDKRDYWRQDGQRRQEA